GSLSTITLPLQVSGTGGLTKYGIGTLQLLAANTFSGPTHVAQATMRLGGTDGAISNTSAVPIDDINGVGTQFIFDISVSGNSDRVPDVPLSLSGSLRMLSTPSVAISEHVGAITVHDASRIVVLASAGAATSLTSQQLVRSGNAVATVAGLSLGSTPN